MFASQESPGGHVPHCPPHPSAPHSIPKHWGTHWFWQRPLTHVAPSQQYPHCPPHPSAPHVRPPHDGVQEGMHWPFWQDAPVGQVPHWPPQPSDPHSSRHPSAVMHWGVHDAMHQPDVHE